MMQSILIPSFQPPGSGMSRNIAAAMLSYGQQIRDEFLWSYPLLPGAIYIYQQMVSEREWKVSGKPRSVARAIEWFNNAQTLLYDGTVDYGLEQFLRRRALDYLAVGRTMFTWGKGGEPLRYLDPTQMTFYLEQREWRDNWTNEKFPVERVVVNHPIPMGNSGSFISPLSFVIPTAMLAWLIREHDRASADGRKIRDIMIVFGSELAEKMGDAVEASLKVWSGADPTKEGVPLVYVEPMPGMKASDMVTRIGLANIPDGFNREQFQFQYVNEIAAAIGLALRYIWNSEKATNRALEEVQEARQSMKGPAGFIRCEQRLYMHSDAMEQFGPEDTRFGFLEEVDIASAKINAEVLKLYAETVKIFKESGINFDDEALIAWLQRDDILPADLDIISSLSITSPEQPPTPIDGNIQRNSDGLAPVQKAVSDVLDYDEISMDGKGRVIERRNKVFNIKKALYAEMKAEADVETAHDAKKIISFSDILKTARATNVERFKSAMRTPLGKDDTAKSIYERIDELKEDDHRQIKAILDAVELESITN